MATKRKASGFRMRHAQANGKSGGKLGKCWHGNEQTCVKAGKIDRQTNVQI